jgi:hypothetical protein
VVLGQGKVLMMETLDRDVDSSHYPTPMVLELSKAKILEYNVDVLGFLVLLRLWSSDTASPVHDSP